MELTLREAATVTGLSRRTLRARLARGDLVGQKRSGRWFVQREALPLTEDQRRRLQARADEIREVVESALPSRAATNRDRRRRSVADLASFRSGRAILADMIRGDDETREAAEARRCLRQALLAMAEATIVYERDGKLVALRRARRLLARCVGLLLVGEQASTHDVQDGDSVPTRLDWVARLEHETLAPLGGLLRWTERLGRKPR